MPDSPAAIEVSPGVWLARLPLPFPVATINVFLIQLDRGYLLLDCGMRTRACQEALAAALSLVGMEWTDIRQIVLSHLHPDHFGLAAEVKRRSGAPLAMHRVEADLVLPRWRDEDFLVRHTSWLAEHGVPAAESEQISQASRGITEFIEPVEADQKLEDGDRIPVRGGVLELIWSPGHSPGLLTLYLPQRKLYFSSDHMIEKITPNIGLHSHSAENPLADYLRSLERVHALDIDLILSSHGQPFHGHHAWIAATQEHHRTRCQQMIEALAAAPQTAYQLLAAVWGNHLSPLNQRFAVAETLAHMEYLRQQGRVAPRRAEGVVRWEKV